MKKYKIKITKIYTYNKKKKLIYEIYQKQKDKTYRLVQHGGGISIKDFLEIWFYTKILHKELIKF